MNSQFQLHERLQQDCILIGRFSLCQLLMMNDSQFPWFILVPERADIKEIYQLSVADRQLLSEESCFLAENMADLFKAHKMNMAAIGNMVPQLHIHHIVRYQTDKAWPAPVWGKFIAEAYTEQQIIELTDKVRTQLKM
ncbi:MAG: HIT domain-containing protein [Methylococcales bacterium]|nr:MAG: HIT domain-containing protein [Methylococcales bacterium]